MAQANPHLVRYKAIHFNLFELMTLGEAKQITAIADRLETMHGRQHALEKLALKHELDRLMAPILRRGLVVSARIVQDHAAASSAAPVRQFDLREQADTDELEREIEQDILRRDGDGGR